MQQQQDKPKALVNSASGTPTLRRIIPHASWEPSYFEDINKRAKQSNLPKLRTVLLPQGDTEVRVWIGFGLTYLVGYVFRQQAGNWSGLYLPTYTGKGKFTVPTKPLSAPRSGWDTFWQKMVRLGLLTLPDSSELKQDKSHMITDGFGYVVEINRNRIYRTYLYSNPEYQKWPQAKQMVAIIKTIEGEFEQ